MKSTLLFIITFFIFFKVSCQNWKSISTKDTTYFVVDSSMIQSLNYQDNYLRCIYIDSTSQNGNDSIFYFPSSIRIGASTTVCLDTLGPTWLGNKFYRNTNGSELFFNQYNDSILLETNAIVGDSWQLAHIVDTIYTATISNLDTLTIDGMIDSIKTMQITASVFGVPVLSYNSQQVQIVLSKNHGFINAIEFYGFPSYRARVEEYYPLYKFAHHKIPKKYRLQENYDFNWVFQTGNKWQYEEEIEFSTTVFRKMGTFDSIISVNWINATDMQVVRFRKTIFQDSIWVTNPVPHDSIAPLVIIDSIMTDTFSVNNNVGILPEIKNGLFQFVTKDVITQYYLDTITECDKAIVNSVFYDGVGIMALGVNCPSKIINISGVNIVNNSVLNGFGIEKGKSEILYVISTYKSITVKLVYYKIGNCTNGNYIPLFIHDNNKLKKQISIYPNPSNNIISLDGVESNCKISIYNSIGQIVQNEYLSLNKKIDISNLKNGVYELKCINKNDTIFKSFIKN